MRVRGKGKLLFIAAALLLMGLFYVGQYFFLDTKNQFGQIRVVSSPETSVFLDNVALGKTPYEGKVRVGEYALKLIPQGEATSTASWHGRIKVFKNSLTFVNRELGSSDVTSAGEIFWVTKMDTAPKDPNNGEIYVESEPIGAIVKLDNDEKGVAPLILADVLKGTHELNIFLPGFFQRTQKINVEAKYRVNALFKLALDLSQKPATPESSLKQKVSTESATTKKTTIKVLDTPTGFLRVRSEPTITASEEAQVKPGDEFPLLDEKSGWYQIEYEPNKEGWISSQYSQKTEQ